MENLEDFFFFPLLNILIFIQTSGREVAELFPPPAMGDVHPVHPPALPAREEK